MDDSGSTFRVVLRGYEPAEVNRRLEELSTAVAQARAQRDALASRLEAAERERVEPGPTIVEAPTFEQLGARVGQILALAQEEADELRRTAEEEVAAQRRQLEEETTRIRDEADRYAAETRSAAETEAARITEDARRAADERLDNAEHDASARIQEAELIYEDQRTKAVQAAADFENTLATRRKAAEEGFKRQMDEVAQRLDQARQTLEEARAEAERTEVDARTEAGNFVRQAEEQAKSIVDGAHTEAARMRSESDRELAAATQRREAINAQLGNVRQMLATLTGSVTPPQAHAAPARTDPADVVDVDTPDVQDAEPADDSSGVDAH
jgi:DNA repair exonuclease SbcCD ATPase subunit